MTDPLPGEVHRNKDHGLEHLNDCCVAAVVESLERAGDMAGLPALQWEVLFDTIGDFQNCCEITGWCSTEGSQGVVLCQQWVDAAANLDHWWGAPVVSSEGVWTASGYMGGLDISVSCVIDPEAQVAARRKEEDERDRQNDVLAKLDPEQFG